MTEAMPFLQKAILLSYAPRPFLQGVYFFGDPVPAGAGFAGACRRDNSSANINPAPHPPRSGFHHRFFSPSAGRSHQ